MKAAVCNSANWEKINPESKIDYLKDIEVFPLGKRHFPINHGEALERFYDRMKVAKIKPVGQYGLLSPDKLKFIFVCDFSSGEGDYIFTLGFINFNDQTKTFTGITGERVFVCSNECFRGEEIKENRKKHTTHVMNVLDDKMDSLIETFKRFQDNRQYEIKQMKSIEFADEDVGVMAMRLYRKHIVSNTNITKIFEEWDSPSHEEFSDRTSWSFQNACTESFKRIENPQARIHATNVMQKDLSDYLITQKQANLLIA